MDFFTKSSVEKITRILQYSDDSEMEVCFNKWSNSCEIYTALPDVKRGVRFMRNTKFQFEFCHLLPLVHILSQVSENEIKYAIAVEKEKRLVLCKDDRFGNWNLG